MDTPGFPLYVWLAAILALMVAAASLHARPPAKTIRIPPSGSLSAPVLAATAIRPPRVPLIRLVASESAQAARLARAIWLADSNGKRRGELTPELADQIAVAVSICAHIDPWMLAALAWTESGFRPSAVRGGSPRMLGMFQLNERYLRGVNPFDVDEAAAAACMKLERWKTVCTHRHNFLAHWFSGTHVNPRGLGAVNTVYERRKILRGL